MKPIWEWKVLRTQCNNSVCFFYICQPVCPFIFIICSFFFGFCLFSVIMFFVCWLVSSSLFVTLHAHARAGVMWSGLVSIYILCLWPPKSLIGTFFVRLALPLHAPEMLSSLSKSSISLFNTHLALFVRRMTQLWSQNHISKYRH